MKKLSTFQTVLVGVFVFFILAGVLGFAGIIPLPGGKDEGTSYGNVLIWGTISKNAINQNIEQTLRGLKDTTIGITYVQKSERTFDQELLEALALGQGPDIISLPESLIIRHKDKISPVSYKNWSERTFRDTFVNESELYLGGEGIFALPFLIDPLVMYWNRDLFSSQFVISPPTTWKDLIAIVPRLTKRTEGSGISKSAVSFGEYKNVANAKEILSMLFLQTGNPIAQVINLGTPEEKIASTFASTMGLSISPAISALQFYTQFSNPVKEVYTWNRALPLSQDMFVAGDLVIYFGLASELNELKRRNPRLNFDVAIVPQALAEGERELEGKLVTFGKMKGLAVLKSSRNPAGAFFALNLLTSKGFIASISEGFNLPPVRKDLLHDKPADIFSSVFYDSALISKGWLDPLPAETDTIFQETVEDIVSGRRKISDAVSFADGRLNKLYK